LALFGRKDKRKKLPCILKKKTTFGERFSQSKPISQDVNKRGPFYGRNG
jgi:hypothetical protein